MCHRTIVTNQVQVGTLKLHPLDLLLRMSPLAAMQCVIYAWMTGEIYDVGWAISECVGSHRPLCLIACYIITIHVPGPRVHGHENDRLRLLGTCI